MTRAVAFGSKAGNGPILRASGPAHGGEVTRGYIKDTMLRYDYDEESSDEDEFTEEEEEAEEEGAEPEFEEPEFRESEE